MSPMVFVQCGGFGNKVKSWWQDGKLDFQCDIKHMGVYILEPKWWEDLVTRKKMHKEIRNIW